MPLFKEEETVGIVGMDINFNVFKEIVSRIQPYKNSYGALLNENRQFLIHPEWTQTESLDDINSSLAKEIASKEAGVTETNLNKTESIISYAKLDNGHVLMISSTKKDVFQDVNQLTIKIFLLLAVIIIIAIFIALIIGNRLTKPIHTLIQDMRKVKEGDLTIQTAINNRDEIGIIGENFNSMVQQLGSLTKNIHQVSERIKASSLSLSAASRDISAAAQEVTASIEEMAAGNNLQSKSVEKCSAISSDLSNKSKKLLANTNEVLSNMEEINANNENGLSLVAELNEINTQNVKATENIEKAILDLHNKIENIRQILVRISGIAEQTNLLALNASIESARAGEAGKGFAVVAMEIQKLAEQSKNSAEDIRKIIATVENDSKTAVEAMQNVKDRAGEQSEAVEEVSQLFQLISSSIRTINDKLKKNGSYITELNENLDQLTAEINEIASIAEENATSSDQVAIATQSQATEIEKASAAIDDLNELVATLNELIKKFNVH